PPGPQFAIVAGPGNHGGDGSVAARILAEWGYRVRTLFVGDPNRLTGDAAVAAQGWRGPSAAAAPAGLMSAEVVVDALFGAGLDRPVEGLARAMIEATNTASCVYAVDLPSGINGTTGAVMGVAVNAAASLAVMVRPVDGADELAEFLNDRRRNVVVLGPGGGMGRPMRELVLAALAGERAVVLDADALTSFAGEPQALTAVTRARTGVTIMTPHEGEFSRLFKAFCNDAPSKLEKARSAARQTGAVILLKGPDTVVAAPDGRAAIAENAPPWLAT